MSAIATSWNAAWNAPDLTGDDIVPRALCFAEFVLRIIIANRDVGIFYLVIDGRPRSTDKRDFL